MLCVSISACIEEHCDADALRLCDARHARGRVQWGTSLLGSVVRAVCKGDQLLPILLVQ